MYRKNKKVIVPSMYWESFFLLNCGIICFIMFDLLIDCKEESIFLRSYKKMKKEIAVNPHATIEKRDPSKDAISNKNTIEQMPSKTPYEIFSRKSQFSKSFFILSIKSADPIT
jgi:DNA topoisomerase VI subunit B